MNHSGITWLVNPDGTPGYTWSPTSGCGPALPCYDRCWARGWHVRYRGGDFSVKLHPDKLDEPLRLRKPSVIGVSLLGDLFHDDVPERMINAVFGIMARRPRHVFVLLTKRPERARKTIPQSPWLQGVRVDPWPLPNVWLGVSIEDQATADERIPILLDIPAAHRWVSLEPQIGAVNLSPWFGCRLAESCELDEDCDGDRNGGAPCGAREENLDLVIQGCESGPGRRPFDIAWARSVRDQCKAAGVAYYLKQRPLPPCEVRPNGDCPVTAIVSCERNGCPRSVVVERPYLDGRQHLDLPWAKGEGGGE